MGGCAPPYGDVWMNNSVNLYIQGVAKAANDGACKMVMSCQALPATVLMV